MCRIPLRSIVLRWRDGPDPTLNDTFLIPTGQAHSHPARFALHAELESGLHDPSGRTPRYELLIDNPGSFGEGLFTKRSANYRTGQGYEWTVPLVC